MQRLQTLGILAYLLGIHRRSQEADKIRSDDNNDAAPTNLFLLLSRLALLEERLGFRHIGCHFDMNQ